MAISMEGAVRSYGVPKGAAGIRVIERAGLTALSEPRYGTTLMVGALKRGVPGVPIPFNNYSEYQDNYGDPKNRNWALYRDSAQMLPDAVEGYYSSGGAAGQLWLLRLALPGMRAASTVINNSLGAPAMRVTAANPGRWGGRFSKIEGKPLIYATARTFTLNAPDVEANEYVGAVAKFSDGTEKEYEIVANTKSSDSGEVVFTIAAQYSLIVEGVSGPTTLSGLASYNRYRNLTGTATYSLFKPITGAATATDRVVTGTGTKFVSELKVGANLYMGGEARVVDSITSDTTATVTEAYSVSGAGDFEVDNLVVTGASTLFSTELKVGQTLYVQVGADRLQRTIAAIASNTSLTLESGFDAPFTASVLSVDNDVVTGVGSAYGSELQAGLSHIVDPNRSGAARKVIEILSATQVRVAEPFSRNFSNAQITKQSVSADVTLVQQGEDGLSVEIVAGTKFPQTHFGINVRFNGTQVYTIPDASLDPTDRYFVEPLVNNDGLNTIYTAGSVSHQRWIKVESLWDSSYTTNADTDVRPVNGSGKVLLLTETRLYTVAEMDYSRAVGRYLYPDPYVSGRSSIRVNKVSAPKVLTGTIASLGTVVTGTGTLFRSQVKVGDYLYDSVSKSVRKVRAIISNTQLNLDTAFTQDLPALSNGVVAGYLETDRGYNLMQMTAEGRRFTVAIPQMLTGGYDGDLAGLTPYSYTQYFDQDRDMISNALWGKRLGLVKIAIPGVSDIVAQKAAANYAEISAYEFHAEIPSNYMGSASAERFLNEALGRSDFQSLFFPSYGYISNPVGGGDRMVPIAGDILGGEASYANANNGYHFVFAGTKAKLSRITRLTADLSPQDEQLLNLAGIVSVKFLNGNCVVWGGRATASTEMYSFLHVRRIQSNYVRIFMEDMQLMDMLFQPNQPELLERVILLLDNWARGEYKKGVFTQYLTFKQAVEIAGDNTGKGLITDDDAAAGLVKIINGKLNIYVRYIPTGIVEELGLNISPDIIAEKYGQTLRGANI